MVADRMLLGAISHTRYELPRDIAVRVGKRRINAALGCLDLVKAQLIQEHQEDEDD